MRVIVLGTSAGFAGRDDACSSYLLTVEEKNYLIDAGPGSLASLQNHIDYRDLSAILISHLHADHVSDLYTLRFAVLTAQKENTMPHPFPIYMPDRPASTFDFIRENIEEEFDMRVVGQESVLDLGGLTVSFVRTRHPVLAHAMRFEHRGKCFVYTSDTSLFDDLAAFCSGADLLLAEATLQDAEAELEELGHMTARSAGMLAERAGVGQLVLTHIWPEYERGVSLDEARSSCSCSVRIAEKGMEITL
jgi:ribonuclease BN (tRNA processing enzyme)